MGTVPVRIRHIDDAKAVPFTEWPLNDLGSVIREVKAWGLSDADGSVDLDDMFGQFVVTGTEAYFEVIIGDGEE